jgi:glycosyltransferase involved in cell wall biosynthesis
MMGGTTSVIVPVRNGASFVGEAVASALGQLDAGDEIIVVDDASTDHTQTVLAGISDSRLKRTSCCGLGVSAARNVGLAAASGEYVAFLDHDDVWPAARHTVMSGVLDESPHVDAVFGRMRVKFEVGAQHNERMSAMDGRHVGVASVGTGLFRRHVIARVGGFDESLHFGEDVDFYLRLMEAGMWVQLCDIDGLVYRRHASNTSNDLLSMERGLHDVLRRRIIRKRIAAAKN